MFSGIKILDLTRVFSGPFATRHFADYGAEVLKIEPLTGDDSRYFPPLIGTWSGYFELLNRNKTSLPLNLKNQTDLETLYALCKDADIFVENFSPTVTDTLKISYDKIKEINPSIIYASIRGVSDNVVKKYYDVIAQAESGLISLNGETNDVKISTSIVDAFSGMKLAFAISSCLYFREKHHRGQRIVVSMKGSAFDLLEQNLVAASLTQKNPYKVGNMDNAIAPFGVFSVSDGSIVLAIGNDSLWTLFVDSFKHYNSSLQNEIFATNDSRVEHITLLKTEIEKVFQNFDKRSLLQLLVSLQIPCSEVKTMIDVLKDQENFDEGLLTTYVVPTVGPIVVPTGGISFSESSPISCTPSPILKKRQ